MYIYIYYIICIYTIIILYYLYHIPEHIFVWAVLPIARCLSNEETAAFHATQIGRSVKEGVSQVVVFHEKTPSVQTLVKRNTDDCD